jgi:hypothetical protein
MPIVELFKQKGKCIEVNTGQKRDVVYAEVKAALAPMTESLAVLPLTEKSEILLGAPAAASPPLRTIGFVHHHWQQLHTPAPSLPAVPFSTTTTTATS